jgi:hypothetical protein
VSDLEERRLVRALLRSGKAAGEVLAAVFAELNLGVTPIAWAKNILSSSLPDEGRAWAWQTLSRDVQPIFPDALAELFAQRIKPTSHAWIYFHADARFTEGVVSYLHLICPCSRARRASDLRLSTEALSRTVQLDPISYGVWLGQCDACTRVLWTSLSPPRRRSSRAHDEHDLYLALRQVFWRSPPW